MKLAMKNESDPDVLSEEPSLDLRRYLDLALHWAWFFAIAATVAGAAGYFMARREQPVYSARTTIWVNEAPSTRFADWQSVALSEQLAPTYTKILTSRTLKDRVREAVGLGKSEMMNISVRSESRAMLLEIQASHTDPDKAAEIANTLVRVFSDELILMQTTRYAATKASLKAEVDKMEVQLAETQETLRSVRDEAEKSNIQTRRAQYQQIYSSLLMNLEQVRLAEAQATSNVTQIDPALPPSSPTHPRPVRSAMIAAFFGFLLAAGAVFAYEALDDTIKNPEEISRATGLPTLGVIAHHETGQGELIALKTPRSPVVEAFRSLRTNVHFAGVDRPLRRLMVTSPTPVEGKTTVSANLAVVLAQGGLRVCLVDGDMRRPMVHKALGIPNTDGLTALFVRNEPDLGGVVIDGGTAGLQALPAGALPPNPSELLGSNKMKEILDALLKTNDMVVVDTPPVLPVTDAAILTRHVDGILVVYRPGTTKRKAMKQAVEQLRRIGANLIGLVANDVDLGRRGYGNYYYRKYYSAYNYYTPDKPKTGLRLRSGKGKRR